MRCQLVKSLLHRYIDGELDSARHHEVEMHLTHCRECTCIVEFTKLQQVIDATDRALSNEPTPEGLDVAIMAGIQESSTRKAASRRRRISPLAQTWERLGIWGEWLRGPGQAWINWSAAAAACLLVAYTFYVANIESFLGTRQTLLLGQQTFAWNGPASLRVVALTDAESKQPMVNAPVTIQARGERGGWHELYSGRTNAAGTMDAFFHLPPSLEGNCRLYVQTGSGTNRDIVERVISVERKAKILLTTDKPLYQPGQTMHLRVLAMHTGARRPAAAQPVTFEIKDPKGTRVFRRELQTSQWGIAATDFQLADIVNQGRYQLVARMGNDETEKTVTVKPYVLPKFKLLATTHKSYYTPGDTLRGTINSAYFFGKPVNGGRVEVELAAYDTAFNTFARIQGTTDSAGNFSFDTPLPNSFAGQPLERGEAVVRLGVKVTDRAGHQEQVVETVPVAAQPFQIAVVPESGEPAWGLSNIFYVVTNYPDGTVARTRGTVQIDAGESYDFATDSTGIAAVTLPVGNESFVLTVNASDSKGQQATAQPNFDRSEGISEYLRSESMLEMSGYRGAGINDSILLRTDQSIYRVGDTVKAEAWTLEQNGTVYLDVTRAGQTVLTRSTDFKNGRYTFAIDLSDDLAGTLTLNAYYLTPKLGMVRDTRTVIVQPANDLRVAIQPSKPSFRPGEEGIIRFSVTDKAGACVPGAIGLSIVDESVFALREAEAALERDYFSLERSLMQPRYQEKFNLPASLYPGASLGGTPRNDTSLSADPLQNRAAVALACLPGPKNFRINVPPKYARYINRMMGDSRLDTGDNDYSLWVESLPARTDAARDWRKVYFEKLYLSYMAFAIAFPILPFLRRRSWLIIPGIVVAMFLGKVMAEPGNDSRAGLIFVSTLWMSLGVLWRWVRFTWIDALASLAILGVLAAILFPVFARSRENARRSTALGGIRQLAMAQLQQAEEKQGMGSAARPDAPRLRQYFPETLFWQPEIITDEQGQAEVTVPLADSITTWRMSALASSAGGQIGSASAGLRVFQEFFIDPDLPVSLTQGDWLSIPVAVHNYLPRPQQVTVTLRQENWFNPDGAETRTVRVPANDVSVVHFPLTALRFGRHSLTFTARGQSMSDAIKRDIEVLPNGEEVVTTTSDRLSGAASHDIAFSPHAIAGTERVLLKVHPGTFSQVVEGLDGLLQVPYGCFEQTSSITYPNILILDYLKRTRKATPEVQMKAEQFINMGYQRILTFETPGGGFDWFGDAPAKTVLTAYGLMELADMAKVATVDPALLQRARDVLLQRQQSDGSWPLDIRMHTWSGIDSNLPVTAYVTWALAYERATNPKNATREAGEAISNGLKYLDAHLNEGTDPYILALAANAFATDRPTYATTRKLLDWLDARKSIGNKVVSWTTDLQTLTYGRRGTGSEETTALAAQAFLKAGRHTDTATQALTYLIRQRGQAGAWSTTQSTILALQALLTASDGLVEKGSATIRVQIDGREAPAIVISDANYDVMQQVDLTSLIDRTRGGGKHRVTLSINGDIEPICQLVTYSYVPWRQTGMSRKDTAKPIQVDVAYDRTELRQNDILNAIVKIRSNSRQSTPMLIADIGLAPGFTADSEGLSALVRAGRIERFEITPRQLILYLRDLGAGQTVSLPLRLRARFPVRAGAPPSVVYEYYTPQNRDTTGTATFRVRV